MKKKALCLALSAVLMASSLVAFAACKETGSGGPADPSTETGDVVLSFLHAGTLQPSTDKVEARNELALNARACALSFRRDQDP